MDRPSFNSEKFSQLLADSGYMVEYFPTIDSTNIEAKRYLRDNPAPRAKLLVTDSQSAGRGRLGRSWEAPPASGIMCTLVFPLELPLERAFLYTASLALSVTEAVREVKLDIKWPNDLLRQGKKVGGILAELEMVRGKPWLALGFGLNVSLEEQDFEEAGIADKATNLTPSMVVPREELLVQIVENHNGYRQQLRKSPQQVKDKWSAALVTLGQQVHVLQDGALLLEGIACWVEDDGALIIEDEAGEQHRVQAGDVSVRLPDGRYSA